MRNLQVTGWCVDKTAGGWLNGFLGVLIFSGSLPATRAAVMDFDPVFLTVARATIAALLGIALLLAAREKLPERGDVPSLVVVAIGVVIGYPLLTALALQHITSAHSIVFVGLLPLATAIFGVLRGGERPRAAFWLFSCVGSALVVGYAVGQGLPRDSLRVALPFGHVPSGLSASPTEGYAPEWERIPEGIPRETERCAPEAERCPEGIPRETGDMLMLAAIVICGLGYAEGAKLSRKLGGWQVICWALALSLPLMLALFVMLAPPSFGNVGMPAWLGLAYVSLFSMLIGFVFWYRGLAQGGIAAVGQLQLLQPFLGLALAATLLGEQVSIGMLAVTLAVVACVVGAKRLAA
jgi:drug/metabolite transporter (DMT)-like permease